MLLQYIIFWQFTFLDISVAISIDELYPKEFTNCEGRLRMRSTRAS